MEIEYFLGYNAENGSKQPPNMHLSWETSIKSNEKLPNSGEKASNSGEKAPNSGEKSI